MKQNTQEQNLTNFAHTNYPYIRLGKNNFSWQHFKKISRTLLPPLQSHFQKSSLPQPSLPTKTSTLKSSIKLKTNQVISYNDHKGIKYRAKGLSRGGKSSGKYKNAYNIEYISPNEMNGTQSWINLDNISKLSVITNN